MWQITKVRYSSLSEIILRLITSLGYNEKILLLYIIYCAIFRNGKTEKA